MWYQKVGKRLIPLMLAGAVCVQPALAASYKLTVPSNYTCPFSDVSKGDWYYQYVSVLNSKGLIAGYDDGRFGPEDPLTSGAALVMILQAAGSGVKQATIMAMIPATNMTGTENTRVIAIVLMFSP